MTTSLRLTSVGVTKWRAAGLALGFGVILAAGGGQAAVTVFGGPGPADDCFKAAKFGLAPEAGIDSCTKAIQSQPMTDHDMAGTYVNRGVIYMALATFVPAQHDFEQAMKLDPKMGEAVVNHGGALIALKHYADGIAEISRGLELNPSEPEKAYFNRALAYESLDDLKAAYYDYSKAAELKPTWDEPRAELARFTVTQR
jgi:tetratricopeptide (TPR) repeat protein